MASTSNSGANIKQSSDMAKKVYNKSDLKWFAISKQCVDPFDTIYDEQACRPEIQDPDHSIVLHSSTKSLHEQNTANKDTQLEWVGKPGASRGQFSIAQFLSSNENEYELFQGDMTAAGMY